jgi:C4-dicarboxylate transporter
MPVSAETSSLLLVELLLVLLLFLFALAFTFGEAAFLAWGAIFSTFAFEHSS